MTITPKHGPDPATRFPLQHYERLCFLKNIVQNPNIQVGDYTYYDDFEDVHNFEKNVKYHFDFIGDKLTIGKFCAIASGVEFILNGGNHLVDAVSSYPFSMFGNGWEHAMEGRQFPHKGDITVGNDVWLGYRSVILAGVTIGDGAIVGAYSVVTKDVPPYTIVAGNPAKEIRRRFAAEEINQLLALRWWDWPLEKITANVHLLTGQSIAQLL
ncbi:MAG TPA: CatB-related O-acetyltransferase [Saprospiraceae bacterium]|nr:CatB-related O-acetyltransferase [Saprospiraceae bacterium]